jgi:hypothetical protein
VPGIHVSLVLNARTPWLAPNSGLPEFGTIKSTINGKPDERWHGGRDAYRLAL